MSAGDWRPLPGWTWSDAHGWMPPPVTINNFGTVSDEYLRGFQAGVEAQLKAIEKSQKADSSVDGPGENPFLR